jgi:COMPASS component SWD1
LKNGKEARREVVWRGSAALLYLNGGSDGDVLTIEPVKGEIVEEENAFRMPVQLDLVDSESEEEFVTIGRGETRRKSPTSGRDYVDSEAMGSGDEKPKSKSRRR